MARPKGTAKTGGRKKGTPNKTTESTRKWLNNLIDNNREQIENDLQALEPKERLIILEKFMQYTTPKMSNVQQNINFDNLTENQLDDIIKAITIDI